MRMLLILFCTVGLFAQQTRDVHGTVQDRDGHLLKGAVVEIEDTRTLAIRSYVVQGDGTYRFGDLNPDVDYTLKARFRNAWTKPKTLSRFSSEKNPEVNLKLDSKAEQ